MKIDVQCHVFPEEYCDFLCRHSVFPSVVKKDDIYLADYDGAQKFSISQEQYGPGQILKGMDDAGIDIAMISCNIPDVSLLPQEYCKDAARLVNEIILDTCKKYSGRFYGIASIPWNLPDEAEKEIRWAKEKGFKSVFLTSRAGDMQVDDEKIMPLYSLCAELDLPVTLHPTFPEWYKSAREYSLVPMLGFQMGTSLALMRLILSGAIEKNKNLKVIMPHAGGVLPFMSGRIWYQTEIMKRGTQNITVSAVEQLKNGRIFYDTVSPSVESIEFLKDYSGTDKILFGTDYPFINTGFFTDLIEKCDLTAEDKEKIFWKNANEVFGLGI